MRRKSLYYPEDAGIFSASQAAFRFSSDAYLKVRKARKSENNDASWKKDKSYLVMMICFDSPTHSTIAPSISATYRTGT